MCAMAKAASALVEFAPAKINLSLSVLGRRADGYHLLESLVLFARLHDRLTFKPGGPLELVVRGPNADAAGAGADNLVLRAAQALGDEVPRLKLGRFTLTKNLPVAAGVGGGSSDAAAALRLLARTNRIARDDKRLLKVAPRIGADVPVCLDPRPRLMWGIGEILSPPLALPRLPAVLVNPGVAVATKDVFAALNRPRGRAPRLAKPPAIPREREALVRWLAEQGNDLEAPAITLQPMIARVLAALRNQPGCALARMSGSGATCFGLFASSRAAAAAARRIVAERPSWWVRPTVLG
jgi:4-diphosphocytidyl-2-C-methyl-D-erythritol kinase